MRYSYIFLFTACVLLAAPAPVFAADGVQFVSQSVFLSQPSAPAGTNILIYASVVNISTATAFTGKVIFKDGGKELGNVGVSLSPGEARVVSISWIPNEGSHAIKALLEDTSGAPVTAGAAGSTQAAAEFTIEAPLPPPPPPVPVAEVSPEPQPGTPDLGGSTMIAAAILPSTKIADVVISTLPAAASSSVAMVFSTIDDARESAAASLDTRIASLKRATRDVSSASSTEQSRVGSGEPLLSTTTAPKALSGTTSAIFSSLYLNALLLLRSVLQSAALSYACIAFVFLFALYLLYCHLSRR